MTDRSKDDVRLSREELRRRLRQKQRDARQGGPGGGASSQATAVQDADDVDVVGSLLRMGIDDPDVLRIASNKKALAEMRRAFATPPSMPPRRSNADSSLPVRTAVRPVSPPVDDNEEEPPPPPSAAPTV
jgi:hypothetical protein